MKMEQAKLVESLDLESLLRELRALLDRGDELLARADGRNDLSSISPSNLKKAETIVEVVSKKTSVRTRKIFSRSKPSDVSLARQICMTLIRAKVGLSTRSVGAIFSRDHMAVVHAEEAINNRIQTDTKFALSFIEIRTAVENQLKP
jgi:chromosomal replication initiation ATPase DnaA